jgi:hypothetical protein
MQPLHALPPTINALFESGKYSDLIVCCGSREFKVDVLESRTMEGGRRVGDASNGHEKESVRAGISRLADQHK